MGVGGEHGAAQYGPGGAGVEVDLGREGGGDRRHVVQRDRRQRAVVFGD